MSKKNKLERQKQAYERLLKRWPSDDSARREMIEERAQLEEALSIPISMRYRYRDFFSSQP